MFKQLTNNSLIEAYENAKLLGLDKDFINLLKEEINNRGIYPNEDVLEKID